MDLVLNQLVTMLTTRSFMPITTTNYANNFQIASSIFSTLQLYGNHSTLFVFEPPTQSTLYIHTHTYICYKYTYIMATR